MPTYVLRGLWIAMLTVCSLLTGQAGAQGFPTRPITIVVGLAAGGSTDVLARVIASKIRAGLNQDVIVENRIGAASLAALNYVRSQPPDGYTLVIISTTITTLPSLNTNAKYTVEKDFSPIAGLGRGVMVLVANPESGIKSVADLLQRAKTSPDRLNWGLASTYGFDHLGAMRIMRAAGVQIATIGYKGDAPLRVDLLAGRVQIAFGGGYAVDAAAGRVTPLAVSSPERSPAFPNVPTFAEVGLKDAAVDIWFGTFGPAGIPADVLATLNREITAAVQTPEVGAVLDKIGFRPMPLSLAQFTELALSSERTWSQAIKSMGIKPE
jgi:tripartite-type tricarboxylate transporter receptor subunit TctC